MLAVDLNISPRLNLSRQPDAIAGMMFSNMQSELPEKPAADLLIPLEQCSRVQRKDLTIVTIGAMLYRAVETADRLPAGFGIEAEVIDARSLVPFDYEPVLASVRKTGRILLTSDACERGSYLATLAADIQELAFDYLDAPVTIVGAPNWIAPPAEMENEYWPQPEWLLDAVHTRLLPLTGYIAHRPESRERRIDAARRGL
jgi:2-oxoisovalerate dehydrogenase E1 component